VGLESSCEAHDHVRRGYASIVFLMGTDRLDGDETEHRATLYVGATRAKFQLLVSGDQRAVPTLLEEIAAAVEVLPGEHVGGRSSVEQVSEPEPAEYDTCAERARQASLTWATRAGAAGLMQAILQSRKRPLGATIPAM
jgi:hypothetical protein